MCWTYIFQYVDNINATEGTSYTATYFNIAAMISFLVGRWVGTGLMRKFNPSRILMYFGLGGVVFAFGTIFLGSLPGFNLSSYYIGIHVDNVSNYLWNCFKGYGR